MAGPKDVTIRAQALDGTWTVIGGEAARGLYPENVSLEADSWGSSVASFNLRRDPRAFFPDIGAFTPIEIDVGSALVWSGRVRETPSQVAQRTINVQCEGWQFHLDDDIYRQPYVHTNIADWRDQRSFLTSNLGTFHAAPQVGVGDGAITIIWPKNTAVVTGEAGGVTLDLGATALWARVVINWSLVGVADSGWTLYARGTDDPDAATGAGPSDAIVQSLAATAGPNSGTFSATKRYVHLFVFRNGSAGTVSADFGVRITGVSMFANPTWESGGASVLKATDVIFDALQKATLLLSSDRSRIQTTSFSIPSYIAEWLTARQAWTAVDSFHDQLKQIDVNRSPVYAPKPTRPLFEVGAHSAIDDDDASANSGAEIYNRALVTAQTPSGDGLTLITPQGVSAQETYLENTAGFGGPGGSFAMIPNKTFKRISYAVRISQIVVSSFVSAGTLTQGSVGHGTGSTPWTAGDIVSYPDIPITGAGTFGPFPWVVWTPVAEVTNGGYSTAWTGDFHVDVKLQVCWGATLVERRSFNRSMQLPVNATIPSDGVAAQQIGSVWLTDHKRTPFRGTVTLTGDESLREISTGRDVGLEQLLLNTGQLMRFSDRTDPDTGGHGRDGRIAAVSYTPATNSAAITIDNSRTNFEALLSRLAVIQGG